LQLVFISLLLTIVSYFALVYFWFKRHFCLVLASLMLCLIPCVKFFLVFIFCWLSFHSTSIAFIFFMLQ
jgi:hypothetical protein